MSDTQTNEANAPQETAGEALRDRYDDKGKVIATSADQLEAFQEFLGTFDQNDPLVDWTSKAPNDGTFSVLAVVKAGDTGPNRLIAMPSRDAFLGNMNAITWAYNRFLRNIINIAQSEDASESQFITVDGTIKAKYDLTAFKSQAMKVVKWLRGQGLQGITVPGLKAALSNAAFASSQFPRAKPDQWKGLLDRMIALAEQQGHDTSLFQFWQATRDAKVDTGEAVEFALSDFSLEDDESEEQAAA